MSEDLEARLDFFYLTYQYEEFVELYKQAPQTEELKLRLRTVWQSEELWSKLL
jgi:hypothetical protein